MMASISPRLPWQKSELRALLGILHTSRRYGGDNTDRQLAELLKRKDIPSEPGATKRKYNESLVKLKIKSLMDRKLIPTSNEMKAKVEEGTSSQDVIAACAVNLGCFDVIASWPENGDQGLEDNVLEWSARIGRDTEMDMNVGMANISDMGARVGISGRRKTPARQLPYPSTKPRLQNTSKEINTSGPQAGGGSQMGMSGLTREVNDLSMAGLSNTSSIGSTSRMVPERRSSRCSWGLEPGDNLAKNSQMVRRLYARQQGTEISHRYERLEGANDTTKARPSKPQSHHTPIHQSKKNQQQHPPTREIERPHPMPSIPTALSQPQIPAQAGPAISQYRWYEMMGRPDSHPPGGRFQLRQSPFDPQKPLQPQHRSHQPSISLISPTPPSKPAPVEPARFHQPSMAPLPPAFAVPAQPTRPFQTPRQQHSMPNQALPSFASLNQLPPIADLLNQGNQNVLPPIQQRGQEHPHQSHRVTKARKSNIHEVLG